MMGTWRGGGVLLTTSYAAIHNQSTPGTPCEGHARLGPADSVAWGARPRAVSFLPRVGTDGRHGVLCTIELGRACWPNYKVDADKAGKLAPLGQSSNVQFFRIGNLVSWPPGQREL